MLNIGYILSQTQIRATVAFDHPTRQASACVAVGREWWSGYHVAPSMANWLNWGRFLGTPILASRRQEQTGSDTVQRLHSKNVDSHGERVRRRGCWNARCFGRAKDASPAGKAPAQMFGEARRPGKFSDARAPFGAKKQLWDSCVMSRRFKKGNWGVCFQLSHNTFPTHALDFACRVCCPWAFNPPPFFDLLVEARGDDAPPPQPPPSKTGDLTMWPMAVKKVSQKKKMFSIDSYFFASFQGTFVDLTNIHSRWTVARYTGRMIYRGLCEVAGHGDDQNDEDVWDKAYLASCRYSKPCFKHSEHLKTVLRLRSQSSHA